MSFYINFKKTQSSGGLQKYCKMRNKVLREISITKADFFSNKVDENKFDSKNLCQQLKSLGYKNKQNESSKIVLTMQCAMTPNRLPAKNDPAPPLPGNGERGGSVVEYRTPEREVRGSRPTSAVLCP